MSMSSPIGGEQLAQSEVTLADERKYSDDEVGEIFGLAASSSGAGRPAPTDNQEGLTLEQLQEVGREVGLSPERVTEAAVALDARTEALPRRSSLGVPVSVGRLVELPRAATDREWEILVADLRETFAARGRVTSRGDAREWTNGNLHALIEPTDTGYRLRLGTRKDGAMALPVLGACALLIGLVLLVTSGLDEATFGLTLATLIPALFALVGGGTLAGQVLRLRRWADTRESQMEHIADRARSLLAAPNEKDDPET